MTATQKFIEDAIAGGWKEDCKGWYFWANKVTHTGTTGFNEQSFTFHEILLDPLAWQAVGKTRGWEEFVEGMDMEGDYIQMPAWRSNWHHFISYLADGKTIEEALALI